ncbi:cohesin domain-containing protein [Oxalobacteraceae bacterium OTU3CAMAD1]|nr:cohesin domain-containing protein [Oxalobacteraceae bacterium OTU3CAMAD1]
MLRKIWICLVMGLCGALLAGCAAELSHRAGMRALEERDYAEAVAKLKQASEAKPGDIEYRRDLLRAREVSVNRLLATAAAAAAEGKYAEARRDYQTILDFDRTNARAQAGMDALSQASAAAKDAGDAREALKRGDIERANELAGRALIIAPNEPTARAVKKEISALQVQEMLVAPGLGAMYKKPINLEFRDASIKMVFDALARTTGINFIFDRDVRGDQRTTVFLKQTTLDDAIDVILSTSQLEKKVLNASSVLIYPNTPAKAREYQDLIVRAFYMANVEAKQAANMLKTVLKLKDVYVDDRSNMLILRESPETVAMAERLIALQDLEEPEVMLEIEVLEIDRTRLLNLGVEFPTALTVAPLGGNTSSGGATGSTLKLSELKGLNSERIGITLPTATLNLQKQDGDANLLANPRIRVRDREKAKILIGDKVPVVTTTSSGTFVTENIQYLDVGLKLEVEPDIHLHDEIGIKVALEVSSLVSSVKTNNGSEAYQIGTRNFNSSLRLKDGETQILAGLISDEDRATANRVPLLGDLPLLGRLFSSQNTNRKKTEIVLSITPRLVRNKQRNDLAAESFWSGTEATLRNKPLQLRAFDSERASTSKSASVAAMPTAQQATPAQPAPADAPKVTWVGPSVATVGQPFSLTLDVASIEPLRASSFQVGFNPAEFEVVSVEQGDYFNKEGKGTFTHVVDASGGRVSLGMGAAGNASAQGAGRLITMTFKPLAEVPNGEVNLIGFTPIGTKSALGRPNLPIGHKLTVRK